MREVSRHLFQCSAYKIISKTYVSLHPKCPQLFKLQKYRRMMDNLQWDWFRSYTPEKNVGLAQYPVVEWVKWLNDGFFLPRCSMMHWYKPLILSLKLCFNMWFNVYVIPCYTVFSILSGNTIKHYQTLPVVSARGGAEVALGVDYKTFSIYRTCMRRDPARPVLACFVRTCCTVVVNDHEPHDDIARQHQATMQRQLAKFTSRRLVMQFAWESLTVTGPKAKRQQTCLTSSQLSLLKMTERLRHCCDMIVIMMMMMMMIIIIIIIITTCTCMQPLQCNLQLHVAEHHVGTDDASRRG